MVPPFLFRFLPQAACPVLKKLRLSVLCPVPGIADPFQGCPVFGRRGVVNLLEAANEGPAVRKSTFHGYLQQGKVRVDQQLIGVVHPGSGQMFLECGAHARPEYPGQVVSGYVEFLRQAFQGNILAVMFIYVIRQALTPFLIFLRPYLGIKGILEAAGKQRVCDFTYNPIDGKLRIGRIHPVYKYDV